MEVNPTIKNILKRFSCRSFLPDPIPEDVIKILIEAMRWAPSAGNIQPCFFYIIESRKLITLLAKAAYGQNFIAEAPVVFVVCLNPEKSAARYGIRGKTLYSIQDSAAAIENLMIAAASLGLGSCWVGAFDETMASRYLEIPENLRPVGIIPVGKNNDTLPRTTREPVKSITKWVKEQI